MRGRQEHAVREALLLEQVEALGLPDNPLPSDKMVVVKAGKTPYVRFDLNAYSIPHTHGRNLTVRFCGACRGFWPMDAELFSVSKRSVGYEGKACLIDSKKWLAQVVD
jgi:hypothetical protein